jgi:hypothetical protein
MRIQDRSVPKAATLVGGLVIAAVVLAPAYGVAQETGCMHATGNLVVVDLDYLKAAAHH